MDLRSKLLSFLRILLLATVFFGFPKLALASANINSVKPIFFSAGEDIVISGNNFGDKLGNVYIGDVKYPYYGHSIKSWTDSKIILNINSSNKIYSGKIGIQSWDNDSNTLSQIVYGPHIFVKANISKMSPSKVSIGESVTISGEYFKSQNKPLLYINDLLVDINSYTDRQIKFSVPNNAKSGLVKLVFSNSQNNITLELGRLSISKILNGNIEVFDQWYLDTIRASEVMKTYQGSKDTIVAIIDDGIYLDHPSLKNNIWINTNEVVGNNIDDDNNGYVDDRYGWNFVYGNNNMSVQGTHGTMVAGIIGAYSNGNDFVQGINQKVSLMPVIVSGRDGYINPLNINKAIYYAVDNQADIINLSLGSSIELYSGDFDEAINYAYEHKVLLVVAAGNGDLETGLGVDLDKTKISPVCNDGGANMVLGVGASDEDNKKTKWSNYGSCVDIYAPGVDISSTASPLYSQSASLYASNSGTSFSTPMVSATAALIKSKYPDISSQEIMTMIINVSHRINNINILDIYNSLSIPFSGNIYQNLALNDALVAGQKIDNNKTLQYINSEKALLITIDQQMAARLSGQIVIQVEENGEAWYVFPDNNKKYFLGTAQDAYFVMRKLGLGASHQFITSHTIFPEHVLGKILLDVESHGEAYYINPIDKQAYYMKTGQDAYNIMRDFGLVISNNDLRKISIGELN